MKKNHDESKERRILGRQLARELSREELAAMSGGRLSDGSPTYTCSCSGADDCDC